MINTLGRLSTMTATVNKMRKVMGAPASDADAKIIVDYLMTQNGKQ